MGRYERIKMLKEDDADETCESRKGGGAFTRTRRVTANAEVSRVERWRQTIGLRSECTKVHWLRLRSPADSRMVQQSYNVPKGMGWS